MDIDRLLPPESAAQAFAALGSEPRLEVIRALVRAGPEGLPVGALQERLGIAASTLSHHLRFLAAADLLSQERQGRSLICRARFANIEALAHFLHAECCADAAGQAHEAHSGCGASPSLPVSPVSKETAR
ncbi:transcriptional regulator, ArsR family [Albimonas donghaensis]|uniref:Transcriptional regulator, ArsR family n=1 Tax=Albimonas donghaensis TaxID=356660 RepID=A0A1H2RCA3_9RHOB|nr:metalloregulator ArsR/SmtB family transcription factor [Albimonas donghaensis]SDW17106.1 transcriptional regulator, ArsR family [Albimonas donghaensis]